MEHNNKLKTSFEGNGKQKGDPVKGVATIIQARNPSIHH